MRRALLVVAKVVARVIATIVLLCVTLSAYGSPVWQATPILGALTLVTWGMFDATPALGFVYQDATRIAMRPGRPVVLATAISVPVAFAFGMLDAALLQAQSGCLRTTCAPVLVPILLFWHGFASSRVATLPAKMGA